MVGGDGQAPACARITFRFIGKGIRLRILNTVLEKAAMIATLRLMLILAGALALSGCGVASTVGTVVGTTVDVATTAVSTTVDVVTAPLP